MKSRVKKGIASALQWIDGLFVSSYLKLFNERPGLLAFFFHVIFHDRSEIDLNLLDPQQEMTLAQYRQFIEYYLENKYQFVSPGDILQGLDPTGRYILFTFDDGYFNNQRILPILNEYRIPAAFFICPHYIQNNQGFWWDILYRQRKKKGSSKEAIAREGAILKSKRHEGVECYIVENFGKSSLQPVSDLDRPFTPAELKDFSRGKYVHIGNHTYNHAILAHYTQKEMEYQIVSAQRGIEEITGLVPNTFAYPNGNYSPEAVRILKELGFELAITCDFRKNRLPLDIKKDAHLKVGRFTFSSGKKIAKEAPIFRSDYSTFIGMKKLAAFLRRKRITIPL